MEKKRLKIAYLTSSDARSKHAWSGTQFSIWNALQKHVGDIELIHSVKPFFPLLFGKIATGLSQKLFHKRYNYRHSRMLAKGYARIVNRKLKEKQYDLIVVAPTSTFIPFLKTNIPIVYVGDSTVKGAINYHRALTRLLPFSAKESIDIEGRAFEKAKFLLFSSEWAANSAIKDYHMNPGKVFVAPFGPNMETETLPSRELALSKQKGKECRLLFLGVNWIDKGGSIAFEAMVELNKMGISTLLTICGCVPLADITHPKLTVIPFLDKNNEAQRAKLDELYLHSDFLILPTRFDAFGVVFSEASAFGVPSITTDTGGVPSAVIEGENGYLLPYSATGKEYAKVIAGIFSDDERYYALAKTSRNLFETRSNWDNWAEIFKEAYRKNISETEKFPV
ncbi:MAG TPA: glycosyltransferase family 4 protein [Bacteroidia bacterium]|jgi:glycosyltransferase involved in cell wall biosynthesis|nr:glycosyltransferase family 4 protein [Bacteroidia bacterium]